MVKVIGHNYPRKHTRLTRSVLDLLAIVIVDKPDAIRSFLDTYGIVTDKNGHELANKVLRAIEKGDRYFHRALAKLLYAKYMNDENSYMEDSFDIGSLLKGGAGQAASAKTGGGITVGADPVSAIAGAIGSVANLFGNKQRKELFKQQARSQSFATMMAYKAQREQQLADKQAATIRKERNDDLLKTGMGAIALGLVGLFIYKTVL